ncbi:hypothetical protein Patl1_34285 [Pistacia atlantica]|uniref:Uncharacterized protein n=1 Tax=Pistacia atlantica TaxID=434234 RepID=A0ACC0ZS18_9ROSI|nr:hypothetical protein Patl1_34285 [Pistacia atlantica]
MCSPVRPSRARALMSSYTPPPPTTKAAGKPRIVHCDISSANIILDEKWEAKVAGFGLVTSILADETRISTKVEGSFGYIDPEFFPTGKLNEKVDVYAFGMLLLELITGCLPVNKIQPSDPENLAVKVHILSQQLQSVSNRVIEVTPLAAKPMLTEAVKDNNINVVYTNPMLGKFDKSEMLRMVHCAAACVCYPERDRPQMSQILEALEGKLDVKVLTENIKTMFTAEHSPWDRKKLLGDFRSSGGSC